MEEDCGSSSCEQCDLKSHISNPELEVIGHHEHHDHVHTHTKQLISDHSTKKAFIKSIGK